VIDVAGQRDETFGDDRVEGLGRNPRRCTQQIRVDGGDPASTSRTLPGTTQSAVVRRSSAMSPSFWRDGHRASTGPPRHDGRPPGGLLIGLADTYFGASLRGVAASLP
jgi:hypothetical protein